LQAVIGGANRLRDCLWLKQRPKAAAAAGLYPLTSRPPPDKFAAVRAPLSESGSSAILERISSSFALFQTLVRKGSLEIRCFREFVCLTDGIDPRRNPTGN